MRGFKRTGASIGLITASLMVGLLGCMRPVAAQSPAPSVTLPPPSTQLSAQPAQPSGAPAEGYIGGGPVPQRCIEVEIGGESSGLSCLNEELKRKVERVNPSLPQAPVDARSPDTRIGLMNQAALRQQFGPNFGHSGGPFRPPHR